MRIGRPSRYVNCTIDAPGYGRRELMIEALGYGMSIATQADGTTRRKRVFYPFVRTSGLWYINALFSDYETKESFTSWMVGFLARATNPHLATLKPMTVSVPSEGFTKVGYPTSSIPMGDRQGMASYRVNVGFASASDPETTGTNASKYRSPATDDEARKFYPGGIQDSSYVPPDPIMQSGMPNEADSVWDGVTESVFNWFGSTHGTPPAGWQPPDWY